MKQQGMSMEDIVWEYAMLSGRVDDATTRIPRRVRATAKRLVRQWQQYISGGRKDNRNG